MTSTENNFGLNQEQFDHLLNALKNDDSTLFEQVFLQQFESSMKYLQFKYGATHNEAYDANMDTMLEFRARLIDGKVYYGNLRFLYTRMAAQQLLRLRKTYTSRDVIESDIPEEENFDEEDISKLEKAWDMLGEDCRSILKLNFYNNLKLSEIAEIKNIKAPAIRKKKSRCLTKLLDLFINLG